MSILKEENKRKTLYLKELELKPLCDEAEDNYFVLFDCVAKTLGWLLDVWTLFYYCSLSSWS